MENMELNLGDIYESIESSIEYVKKRHREINPDLEDFHYLRRIASAILEQSLPKAGLQQISSTDQLRALLTRRRNGSSASVTSTSGSSTGNTSSSPSSGSNFNFTDNSRRNSTGISPTEDMVSNALGSERLPVCALVAVSAHRRNNALPPLPSNAFKTPSPPTTRCHQRVMERRRKFKRANESISNDAPDITSIEISRLLNSVEGAVHLLRDTFTVFTQRVLVPLQIFCKRKAPVTRCRENSENASEIVKRTPRNESTLDETEFKVVEISNRIKKLLWSSELSEFPSDLFSKDGISYKISVDVDSDKFPIVRLVPDVIQKFGDVISLATTWLKCDRFYVESAKTALQRAHLRYQKTESSWQKAKNAQNQLHGELENVMEDIRINKIRLASVQNNLRPMRKELVKLNGRKTSLENDMKENDGEISQLRIKHCAVRKRLLMLTGKMEGRERSSGYLESRVLSLQADEVAINEKIRISEEYANDLQRKLEKFFYVRDVLNQRYEEKTDRENLRSKLEQAKLRIPFPALREKSFTMEARMGDLREELNSAEQRLNSNELHLNSLLSNSCIKSHPLPGIPTGRRRPAQASSSEDDIADSSLSLSSQSDDNTNIVTSNNRIIASA